MSPQGDSMVRHLTAIYADLIRHNLEPAEHTVTLTLAQYQRLVIETETTLDSLRSERKRFLGMQIEVV